MPECVRRCAAHSILHLKTTLPEVCLCSSQVVASLARPSLISSLSHYLFVLFIPLIIAKKKKFTPLFSSSSSSILCLSVANSVTLSPLFSVRLWSCIMSSAWDSTFCNLAFTLGPRGSSGGDGWMDGTSLSL